MFQLQANHNISDIFVVVVLVFEDGLSDDDRSVFSSLSRRPIELSCFETINFNHCLIWPANLILACILVLVVNPDASQLDILLFVNIFVPGDIEEIIINEVKVSLEGLATEVTQKIFSTDIFNSHERINTADSASRAFEVICCTLEDFKTLVVILFKARGALKPITFFFTFAGTFVKIIDCFYLGGHVFYFFSVFWSGMVFL